MFDGWGNCEQTHNFGICLWKNTWKCAEISVKVKIHSLLSWSRVAREPKFYEAMTFGDWGNGEQKW